MTTSLKALEMTATVDDDQRIRLDDPLPITGLDRIRIIILLPQEDEISEQEWLKAASRNPAFDFLNDPDEDLYAPTDGKPFQDQT